MSELILDGCHVHPFHNSSNVGGGNYVYVKENYKVIQVEILPQDNERVWIEVLVYNLDKLLLGYIYKSPSGKEDDFNNLRELIVNSSRTTYNLTFNIRDFDI